MLAASKIDLPVYSVYTISKENKADDGEGNNFPIASLVNKILEDSGERNVEVNAF